MSDAIGGVVNVALIVFFIVAIASYMAFNVNYEKAFNVKNEIVSLYEEYEGTCNSECKGKIKEYEDKIGYGAMKLTPKNKERCFEQYGYCVRGVKAKRNSSSKSYKSDAIVYCYFSIRTNVLIDIPIINNLMNLSIFHVTGQTKTLKIYSKKDCQKIANTG
jgi:hypothetical protein